MLCMDLNLNFDLTLVLNLERVHAQGADTREEAYRAGAVSDDDIGDDDDDEERDLGRAPRKGNTGGGGDYLSERLLDE